ncbi:hypothetical protein [Burkholderia multivorans]|uniref:hypothetical protein n=1 Tax=Burkholderia multivorans TaxID=87883 RepID=UPI0020B20CB7|nr:hypothetical protein [Burkholderia multivorans]
MKRPALFRCGAVVTLAKQKELLEQLFEQYERLDEDLKAELPLKRVWMVGLPRRRLLKQPSSER